MIINTEKDSVTVKCFICKKNEVEMRVYNGMMEFQSPGWEFSLDKGRTYVYCPFCLIGMKINGKQKI